VIEPFGLFSFNVIGGACVNPRHSTLHCLR
jgi:hypothetical protein